MAVLDPPRISAFGSKRIAESVNQRPCWLQLRDPLSHPHLLQPLLPPPRLPPETRSSQKTVSIGDRSDFWSCVPPPWHWPSIYSGNKVSFPADGGRSGRVRARFAFLKINKSELAVSYDKLNLWVFVAEVVNVHEKSYHKILASLLKI